jgi:NAD(P)-dependent dehydrogenase (short-subunit alcohol dehydrogenase family)
VSHTPRLAGKIAVITGASRGIGAAVACAYAKEGAQLVLTARNKAGLEEVDDAIRLAGGKPPVLVQFDLRETAQIDTLGAALFERFGKVDIVVGNAAILGELTPLTHADPDMWQKVLDINLTANWRLLRSMHPLLLRSDAGRAVFVTSGAAKAATAYWGAYATSKAALEMLVRTYSAENVNTPICANLIDPGVVNTAMRAQAFPSEDKSSLRTPESVTELFIQAALPTMTQRGHLFIASA